jgi:hypothetical protein
MGKPTPVEDYSKQNYLDIPDEDNLLLVDQNKEDFSEVLNLTEYNGNQIKEFQVADYNKIIIPDLSKVAKAKANSFVSKVTAFILTMNDTELTRKHKDYIKTVGKIEIDNLESLMALIEINRVMIQNIVERINISMGEDYNAIMGYNNLLNQHIKLVKECQTMYRSIPAAIKKLRAEIMTDQELKNENYIGMDSSREIISDKFGESQFNSQKQMLKSLIKAKETQNELHAKIDKKVTAVINGDFSEEGVINEQQMSGEIIEDIIDLT